MGRRKPYGQGRPYPPELVAKIDREILRPATRTKPRRTAKEIAEELGVDMSRVAKRARELGHPFGIPHYGDAVEDQVAADYVAGIPASTTARVLGLSTVRVVDRIRSRLMKDGRIQRREGR